MKPYRVIRLMKNRLYPTFQLRARMRQTRTKPEDGLKLAALITLEWLRLRLGDEVPEALANIPEPEDYRSCTPEQLPSLHINAGYLIDIVSLPEQGVWTLQIGEPDLGSDPGDPEQSRGAVPGRVIETNIVYQIVGGRLECGFRTLISDPEGTPEEAEVYRLAVVRRLAAHPDFGLRQLEPLTEELLRLTTPEQLKKALDLAAHRDNSLPCVFFTQLFPLPSAGAAPLSPEECNPFACGTLNRLSALREVSPAVPKPVDPPYETENFAQYGIGLCRTFLVSAGLLDRLTGPAKREVKPGEILVLEPVCFGGGVRVLPFSPNRSRQEETRERLRLEMYRYPRGREVDFGLLNFLSTARERLLEHTQAVQERAGESAERWAEDRQQLEAAARSELRAEQKKSEELREQLRRQQEYGERLEREKRELTLRAGAAERECALRVAEMEGQVAYLKRKLDRPRTHEEIAAWAEQYFRDRLFLHPKAVALLADKSSHSVDVGLICDALDFLATDYWERRYNHITTEEMNSRCGEKYGRPFSVSPTGTTTIEFTPSQYKVKYFPGRNGKPVESPLDFHLGVGSDPENLLRIYFLHDDDKKRIVVGSLPRHLRAVTIK